jgi:hypothetical protein
LAEYLVDCREGADGPNRLCVKDRREARGLGACTDLARWGGARVLLRRGLSWG